MKNFFISLLEFFQELTDDTTWHPIFTPISNSPIMETNTQKLYNSAKACLGEDLSTDPAVPPEVSCAVAVNAVHKIAFGEVIGGGASTKDMYLKLLNDPRFQKVIEGIPGDIIISPSGYSSKGALHGHVAILGYHGIMGNNSLNGLWQEVYTMESWDTYYRKKLGFGVYFFRRL